ncbi:MAG: glutaredoxin [Ponticaulis sp.]|nr:glutaredoxin [Ponticaulis sp.]
MAIDAADEARQGSTEKTAVLYRKAMPGHLCPFGLKAKDLLTRKGYTIEDHLITTPEENDQVKSELGVETTPQTFINGERIGGYGDLRRWFGLDVRGDEKVTYQPVIAIFSVAFLMALAVTYLLPGPLLSMVVIERFVAISMCILAIQKLQDLKGFSSRFLGYDLLARKWVPYAYIYPFVEMSAGVLMLAGLALYLPALSALFIGTIGAVSVIKAVYIDKRELKCACVGGDANVPLGAISLTENLMMMAMPIWMMLKPFLG